MRAVSSLPIGYSEFDHIDLQRDKKLALKLNITATAIFAGLIVLGHFAFVPLSALIDFDAEGFGEIGLFLLRMGILLAGYIAYIILHELTHAAAMKMLGASNIRFGFTGLYAYAGSEVDYYDKSAYRVIALAPLIIWTILLTIPLILLPQDWFWVFYFIQCGNLTGCAGDIYVTARLWRTPEDILVRDTGVEMFVYSRRGKAGYLAGTKKL